MKDIIFSDQELLKIKYAKSVVKNEFLKLVGFLAVFLLLGNLHLFLISLITLLGVRIYTGGIHYHSQLGCWIISLIFFLMTVYTSYFYHFTFMSAPYILIFIACLITIIILAPIESPYRPLNNPEHRKLHKMMALIIFIITWGLVQIIFKNPQYITVGLMTLTLQCLQMILKKIFLTFKEVTHEKS